MLIDRFVLDWSFFFVTYFDSSFLLNLKIKIFIFMFDIGFNICKDVCVYVCICYFFILFVYPWLWWCSSGSSSNSRGRIVRYCETFSNIFCKRNRQSAHAARSLISNYAKWRTSFRYIGIVFSQTHTYIGTYIYKDLYTYV